MGIPAEDLDVKALSERQFQSQVLTLARLHGWRIHHQRPARTVHGWRTPIVGDKGLPDLTLCRPPRLIYAELKSALGRLTAGQRRWLDDLQACGVEVYVWRPSSWDEIERLLAREGDKF
jgi:hypothetical protein